MYYHYDSIYTKISYHHLINLHEEVIDLSNTIDSYIGDVYHFEREIKSVIINKPKLRSIRSYWYYMKKYDRTFLTKNKLNSLLYFDILRDLEASVDLDEIEIENQMDNKPCFLSVHELQFKLNEIRNQIDRSKIDNPIIDSSTQTREFQVQCELLADASEVIKHKNEIEKACEYRLEKARLFLEGVKLREFK